MRPLLKIFSSKLSGVLNKDWSLVHCRMLKRTQMQLTTNKQLHTLLAAVNYTVASLTDRSHKSAGSASDVIFMSRINGSGKKPDILRNGG